MLNDTKEDGFEVDNPRMKSKRSDFDKVKTLALTLTRVFPLRAGIEVVTETKLKEPSYFDEDLILPEDEISIHTSIDHSMIPKFIQSTESLIEFMHIEETSSDHEGGHSVFPCHLNINVNTI